MRLYLPATLELLGGWHAAGSIPGARLEDAFEAPDDSEEGEYAALMSAADASTALGGRGRRRVVVVIDSADPEAVPVRAWAAVHADTEDRTADADPDDDLGWFAIPEIPELL